MERGRQATRALARHRRPHRRAGDRAAPGDGIWATVGSTNLDRRSFALNEELNVVVYDGDVARRLEDVFEQDLASSRPVTYREWRRRSLASRFLELLSLPLREQM
jgi:cardiolipin synthase A/B